MKTTNVGKWRYAARTIDEASRVLRERKVLEYVQHKRDGNNREMKKAKKEILDIDALKKPGAAVLFKYLVCHRLSMWSFCFVLLVFVLCSSDSDYGLDKLCLCLMRVCVCVCVCDHRGKRVHAWMILAKSQYRLIGRWVTVRCTSRFSVGECLRRRCGCSRSSRQWILMPYSVICLN